MTRSRISIGSAFCAAFFVIPALLANVAEAQPGTHGIRIRIVQNYAKSKWTLCHAYNENAATVIAYFDVYPVQALRHHRFARVYAKQSSSGHGTVGPIKMAMMTERNVFDWPDNTPNISCVLTPPYP
jgi:hypothetical protein